MSKTTSCKGFLSGLALGGALCVPMAVQAEPALQIYIEGATYDATTETWVLTSPDPFKLWVIGNTEQFGTISDVKLSIAYDSALAPTIGLTSTTTGGFMNYTDPSTPGAAVFSQTVTDGSSPLLGDGSSLPTHGIYGLGTTWTEFLLGDFSLMDSPLCDFINSVPDGSTCTKDGQINVYEVAISGVAEGSVFHFDAYDHYEGAQHFQYVFAPFSHDGEGTSSSSSGGGASTSGPVPEPGTLTLMGGALLAGLFLSRRRSQEKARS